MSDQEALHAIQEGLDAPARNGSFATLIVTLPDGGLVKLTGQTDLDRRPANQSGAAGMIH